MPYSLTEEFTAVYRMHPLVPDDFDLGRSPADRAPRDRHVRCGTCRPGALDVLASVSMRDLLYSFGTAPGPRHPAQLPRFLQEFMRPDGMVIDLAAVDILRPRELGVPRYNEFRRLLHLPTPATFRDLTEDPAAAAEIAASTDGDREVDLIVGLFAEPLPAGFAFSDTAFRIFIVMASRRLNSDRFLTPDFTPAVYTPKGCSWIADNTMATVLLRHHPELRAAMRGDQRLPALAALHRRGSRPAPVVAARCPVCPWRSSSASVVHLVDHDVQFDTAGANALVGLKRSEIGDLFRGGSTSIPDGRGRGTVLIGTVACWPEALRRSPMPWSGEAKVVDARAGRLKNLMTPLGVPAIAAQVYEDASWYDGDLCRRPRLLQDVLGREENPRRDPGSEPRCVPGLVFVGHRLVLNFALEFAHCGQSR